MGGGFYKRSKVINALEHLERTTKKFLLKKASKENYQVKSLFCPGRPFPVAANHSEISRFIMEKLGKLLEQWEVCTQEEFLELIK